MEKIENGCILLKQKEYDELLKKAEENRSKEILIKFGYYSNISVSGNITLSEKLTKQITNICRIINSKSEQYVMEQQHDIRQTYRSRGVNDTIDKMKELVWYKRLFFKEKYVRD